jgi:excisionase family DNA binding protein
MPAKRRSAGFFVRNPPLPANIQTKRPADHHSRAVLLVCHPNRISNMNTTSKIALSVAEALYVMNIGRTKFYEEVKAKRIKVIKLGNKTLIPATEPAEWLKRLAGTSD